MLDLPTHVLSDIGQALMDNKLELKKKKKKSLYCHGPALAISWAFLSPAKPDSQRHLPQSGYWVMQLSLVDLLFAFYLLRLLEVSGITDENVDSC
jgi:hypothetical protein